LWGPTTIPHVRAPRSVNRLAVKIFAGLNDRANLEWPEVSAVRFGIENLFTATVITMSVLRAPVFAPLVENLGSTRRRYPAVPRHRHLLERPGVDSAKPGAASSGASVKPVSKPFNRRDRPDMYVKMVDMGQVEDAPLGYLLYRAAAALRPEVSAMLGPLGLTLPQFVCLRIVSMSPGLSSAELSRHAGVTPQAMNTVLRELEGIGAVARPASVSSGRALPATLTSQGRALLKRAESAVRAADARVLGKLTAAQQREFKRMLSKLGSD
jgi:DNA-binding MarR family transcriptional regulator